MKAYFTRENLFIVILAAFVGNAIVSREIHWEIALVLLGLLGYSLCEKEIAAKSANEKAEIRAANMAIELGALNSRLSKIELSLNFKNNGQR